MSEDFTCYSPTRVHFGEDALGLLGDELKSYGPNVMLSYGGDSIKRSGIYDQLVKVLRKAGKTIIEDGGVMANPVFVIHRDYGRIEPVEDEEKLEEPILTVNDRRMPCPDIGSVLEGARKVRKEGVQDHPCRRWRIDGRLCQGGLGLCLSTTESVGLLLQAFWQARQSMDTSWRGANGVGYRVGDE